MNTTTQIDLLKSEDKNVRNAAIAQAKIDGMPVKEIAEVAGINAATVYRIAANWAPEEPVAEEPAEAAAELAALEAEAVAAPAVKAKATKAQKAAAKQAEKDAAFEEAAPKAKAEPKVKAVPVHSILVDGEHYVIWTRTARNGDHLTVAQPQAIGADPTEGKWVTFCEKHQTLVYTDTQKEARSLTAAEFCDDCRKAAKAAARKAAKAAAAEAAGSAVAA